MSTATLHLILLRLKRLKVSLLHKRYHHSDKMMEMEEHEPSCNPLDPMLVDVSNLVHMGIYICMIYKMIVVKFKKVAKDLISL